MGEEGGVCVGGKVMGGGICWSISDSYAGGPLNGKCIFI